VKCKPCDEIATDTLDAQSVAERKTGLPCTLDIRVVMTMIREVAERYEPELELEPILDHVLHLNLIAEEPERTGYKCALGKVFYRRWKFKEAQEQVLEDLFAATPFAPQEQDHS
jgi:hypothetical protein